MKLKRRFNAHNELHANSLNDILFILLFFFLIVATLGNPNIVKLTTLPVKKIQRQNKTSLSLSIRIKNYFLGKTNRHKPHRYHSSRRGIKAAGFIDTPSVVVNADTSAYYGEVFKVMQSAKRAGAKVVAIVK